MSLPRALAVLTVVCATAVHGGVAWAATPSSGVEPVTAEERTQVELVASRIVYEMTNQARRDGTLAGETDFGHTPAPELEPWTDIQTVARAWSDEMFNGHRHNPDYWRQYGHHDSGPGDASENVGTLTGRWFYRPLTQEELRSQARLLARSLARGLWYSDSHRRNWMRPRWDHVGVGISVAVVRDTDPAGRQIHVATLTGVVNFRNHNGTTIPSRWCSFDPRQLPPNESDDGCDGTSRLFDDVPSGHTFAANIRRLAAAGVTRGCNPPDNTRFCPDQPVTRGQMAAFLTRALHLPAGTRTFRDTAGHVFEADVAALHAADITRGCDRNQTNFCPDQAVTRGQMAAFLDRALELAPGSVDFTDSAGHLFEHNISALAAAGITRGCNPPDNTRFCPDQAVTRAQMAAFLDRAGLLD